MWPYYLPHNKAAIAAQPCDWLTGHHPTFSCQYNVCSILSSFSYYKTKNLQQQFALEPLRWHLLCMCMCMWMRIIKHSSVIEVNLGLDMSYNCQVTLKRPMPQWDMFHNRKINLSVCGEKMKRKEISMIVLQCSSNRLTHLSRRKPSRCKQLINTQESDHSTEGK